MKTAEILDIVTTDSSHDSFYPTPERLAEKMLEDLDLTTCRTVLEPSAGKGDLLRALAKKATDWYGRSYRKIELEVDAIEIDPYLRQILKYNFSEELETQVITEKGRSAKELEGFFEKGIHIVHDDFLTYTPYTHYDLIIMNPPFANGDKHLLKALKIQKNGGIVICLLNAETLRNPCTESRRELLQELVRLDAQIEYIEDAFTEAERRTSVEVALVKVRIPFMQEDSEIYNRFQKAEEMEDVYTKATDLEVTDYIQAAVNLYNVEVKSGLELIRQYRALVPYMLRELGDEKSSPILRLTDSTDRGYDSVSVNSYLKQVRLKYWKALLSNPKFTGKLTTKMQENYRAKVNSLASYDFSVFNIQALSAEMSAHIKQGVEAEILKMFDRMTEHSYYPECQKNRHLFDGWKTNSAHKIGKKVIIPCYGVFDSWDGSPRTYRAREVLEDIERILNFLDGGMSRDVDFWNCLENHFKQGITKNIPLKFFTATFYKKGTVHLVFNCPELIDRFNIYCCRKKNWLPPDYGKKSYSCMSAEERKVVDSFNGNGNDGSGEDNYSAIRTKAEYYLAEPTKTLPMLTAPG